MDLLFTSLIPILLIAILLYGNQADNEGKFFLTKVILEFLKERAV